MAPTKPKPVTDNKKQKSLTSWFAKGPDKLDKSDNSAKTDAKASLSSPESLKGSSSQAQLSQPHSTSRTLNDGSTTRKQSSAPSSQSSPAGRSVKDTPPTSDPIDVDMISASDEDDQRVRVKTKTIRSKRKLILEDSDEDTLGFSNDRKASMYRSSSPDLSLAETRTKRRRVSAPLNDEEDLEEDNDVSSSFSKQLMRFTKSPRKSIGKSRSTASDDDDFIVPSDSEIESKSAKSVSQRSRSSSSALSHTALELSDEEENEEPKAKKVKSTSKKSTSGKTGGISSSTSGGFSFLTAAEQREQNKKDEKKSTEDPYSFLNDVMDKDRIRPGEPNYDPRTLFIPKKAWADFTPFEKQFWEIKQNHFDTILFFQKGKFLELYEDDARIGHREFDLKLTTRVKMSMVGVPESSFSFWAAKFLGKGYKVGRVDQAETALGAEMRLAADKSKSKSEDKGKDKIVRRELNKVYTNGTLVDAELLIDDQAGHCISIREESWDDDSKNTFGICVLDSSTSHFNLSALDDDICRTKLETLMRQLRPKEILFTKGKLSVSTTRLLKAILPAACIWTSLREVEGFGYQETLQELKALYCGDGNDDMDEDVMLNESVPGPIREMADSKSAIEALGAMIWYLRQLNIDKDILSMKNFNVYDPMKRGQGLILDGQTLAHIEVMLNNEGTEDGSLLKLLGRCVTPFGKRLFRVWLCMPLREVTDINARLDAVQDLLDHPTFESDFTDIAKGLPDLERIVSRVHAKNCKTKDFLKVLTAFRKLSKGMIKLADESETFKSTTILGLLRSAPDLLPHIENVERMYRESSGEKDADELIPQEGKDEVYDNIMSEITGLEEDLVTELKKFEKKLGCSLTYWHSAQGNKEIYLVQTKSNQKGIPKDWTKSGSTKAATRWLVPVLQQSVRSLKEARENRNTAIKAFKFRLFSEFDKDRATWLRAIRVFAELDCLFSLAKASNAIGEPSCRPEFVEGDAAWVEFEELRHPTLSTRLRLNDFIPNNIKLGGDVGKIALLTGPNMAGKSTVMRMTATGVIMAQLGMLVPAKKARLCPVDAILTRMGAYDNMFSNASTFKVELDECCKILRDATPKSLVILDELGRGTSTYDGMAIAGAVLHQLATHTLSLSFFATHYGSLTDDFMYHPNIRNMHMSTLVDEERRDLIFLFKLVDGVATSSFGTHVANLAGVPEDVVARADVVSKTFAQQFKKNLEDKQKLAASKLPLVAQADFAYLYGLATGKLQMPADPVRQKEVLRRLKQTVRLYK